MAKLTVKLKQHTPLIHFEHEVDRATLRATELKPKLDRFLIENVFEGNYKEYYKYLVGYDEKNDKHKEQGNLKPAFDFKMKIKSEIESKVKNAGYISKKDKEEYEKVSIKPQPKTPYFGDNISLILKNLEIEFFSFNKKLIEKIQEILPKFFIFNNFGSRQSKAFGSFTPISYSFENETDVKYNYDIESILKEKYEVFYHLKDNKGLEKINQFYSSLKSGSNFGKYVKSKLVEYYENEIRWEKAIIKEKLKENYINYYNRLKGDNERSIHKEIKSYRYVRALLGLAEHIEFSFSDDNYSKLVFAIKNEEIKRFQSPLFFKIIKDDIYILPQEIPNELYNIEFSFELQYKEKTKNDWNIIYSDEKFLKCFTPSKEEFNLIDFLDKSILDVFQKKQVTNNA